MENMRISSVEAFQALVKMGRLIAEERADTLPSNSIIDIAPVLALWEEGQHNIGSLVRHDGQPWRCLQTHDSTGNPDWRPGFAPSLWGAYHGTTPDYALPWQAPTGAHDCYNKGEFMIWTDDNVYQSLFDGNVYSPEDYPNGWAVYTE